MKNIVLYILILFIGFQNAYSTDKASSLIFNNSCISLFLDRPVYVQPTPHAPKKVFDLGYKVSESGQLIFHILPGNNIFEKSINHMANLFFQGLMRLLSAHHIYPKIESFLKDTTSETYFKKLSRHFGLDITIEGFTKKIPSSGPLIIVANHPLSGIDGIALAAKIEEIRPDVKIALTNLLSPFPGMKEHSIFVNPFGGAQAQKFNSQSRLEMIHHLKNGGAIIIFPSGELSAKDNKEMPFAMDRVWKKGVAHLLNEVPESLVTPIFIDSEPSKLTLKFKKYADQLTTVMIVKDLTNRISESLKMVVGSPVSKENLKNFDSFSEQMEYLRARTYALKDLSSSKRSSTRSLPLIKNPDLIINEISQARTLYDRAPENPDKGFKVVIADAKDIPNALLEIGRLREGTFSAIGEGSGKDYDLDQFDQYYKHIIVFDKDKKQIAGSYRIGLIDEILDTRGYDALYTSNFFDYRKLSENFRNGIELGRSFVTPEYQRSLALFSLFSGIAQFLIENPKYKHLIGSVSIPNNLKDNSKLLLVEYLKNNFNSALSKDIQNKTPLEIKSILGNREITALLKSTKNLKDISLLIEDIEGGKNKIPPLIEIYLGLGVRFLAFDFDKSFNTVDGFIWTDLSQQPFDVLKKYMGEEGAKNYLLFHKTHP